MRVEAARRRQKAAVFVGLLFFQLLLLLLQIWLFVMTLEHLIGGNPTPAVPASIASLLVLGVQAWMLAGINRLQS